MRPVGRSCGELGLTDATTHIFLPYQGDLHYLIFKWSNYTILEDIQGEFPTKSNPKNHAVTKNIFFYKSPISYWKCIILLDKII